MAGSVSKFVERMRYWCEEGNLGYDQSNRWDIRKGGECDCSSLVLWCLYEAGFIEKPTWGNTATLESQIKGAGWGRVPNNGKPKVGDILLNVSHHVAVCVASGKIAHASIDENGRASGGKAGDQTGKETCVRSYYDKPWDFYLRYGVSSTVDETTATVGYEVSGLPVVKKGSEGATVKSLQALLNAKNNAGLIVDGEAGSLTDSAIRAYQKAKGLEVDGEAGKATWSKLLTT